MKPSCLRLCAIAATSTIALVACGGTGAGGSGDPADDPDAALYGDGTPVDDLVGPATWHDRGNTLSVGCDTPSPRDVRVTGLTVTAVDRFDETNEGRTGNVYTVQTPARGEAPEPFDALTLRTPGATPPDLRVFPDDVVDVSGSFVEFLGPPTALFGACETLPQVEGTLSYRFDGAPVEPLLLVPATAEAGVDRWSALKGYQAGRPYIGMLVKLENVTIVESTVGDDGALRAAIDVGGGIAGDEITHISNELYDIVNTTPAIGDGATFASVTGILTYFYSFPISPRSPADFVQ